MDIEIETSVWAVKPWEDYEFRIISLLLTGCYSF